MRRRFFNNNIEYFDINDYLTIEALEDSLQIYFPHEDLMYSIDGFGWQKLIAGQYSPPINAGQTISFKGNVNSSMANIKSFTITKRCNLLGNCMSLTLNDVPLFYGLFADCTTIVHISKNFLPATTLADYCYNSMFRGCTSLTTAPTLPATTLANNCYNSMFYGCTSLRTAPALPATTLTNNCYNSMFYGCISLTTAPTVLPAMTLANYCYEYMFYNCRSLIAAPGLPATTLANSCYHDMFYSCTSLTTAPELPATTLVSKCYKYMFYGCTNLNYIKMFATDISASDCLKNWVYNVSSTGTFVKNSAMTTLPTGYSGIPSGWTVVNDGEESEESNLSLVIDYNNLTQNDVDQIINYMVDNGWTTDNRIDVQVINSNITVLYKNTEYPITWIIRSDGGNVGGSFWLMLYTTDIYNMPYFAIDEESLGIRFED